MPKTLLANDEMRDRALDVALDLMRGQGFEKVRLSKVAKAIGVSHAALYTYFADRAALLDDVIQRWLEEIDEQATKAAARDVQPETKLINWFLARYEDKRKRAKSDPELYRAYNFAVVEHKNSATRHWARMTAQLTSLMREAGLGEEREAMILLDAMQAYNHPALIAAQADKDRTEDIIRLLGLIVTGLKVEKSATAGAYSSSEADAGISGITTGGL